MRDCGKVAEKKFCQLKVSRGAPVLHLTFPLHCRLKNFDPDNDDESLSNLETQCHGKEELQPLHGAGLLPAGSLEYMESGRTLTFTCRSSTSLVLQPDSPPACPLPRLTPSPHQSKRTSTTSCWPT